MFKNITVFWFFILLLVLGAIYLTADILPPFVFGVMVAYFLDPFVTRLEDKGLGRSLATVIALILMIFFILLFFILVTPVIVSQISGLLLSLPAIISGIDFNSEKIIPSFLFDLFPQLSNAQESLANGESSAIAKNMVDKASMTDKGLLFGLVNEMRSIFRNIFSFVISSGGAIFSLISFWLIFPVIAFYMIRDWSKVLLNIQDLIPMNKKDFILGELKKIDEIVSAYLRGQFSVCLVMGVFYSIGLLLVGLDYAVAIGFLTGLLSFIPYVGMFLGVALGALVGFGQFGLDYGLLYVLLVFLSGNIVEGNILTPKLVGDKVQLHPAWIIFALMAGGAILGFLGILLAIPVAAVIGVLVRTAISKYKASKYYNNLSGD